MPIHEFTCQSCNSNFELLLMSKEEMAGVRCPICQSPEVQRLLSAANISVAEGKGKRDPSAQSIAMGDRGVQQRTCESGSCTTFQLSGHEKDK